MYRKSFPKCKIEGDFEPVEFEHLMFQGAVPKKCSLCSNLFEGECLRGIELMEDYLTLDHGACKIEGLTHPVEIEIKNGSPIYVPKKCLECQFLLKSNSRGYICISDKNVWGDFPRSLDWGDWKPDYPIAGLRIDKAMIVTKELIALLIDKKTVKAIKLYRALNAIDTIKEASDAIKTLSNKLNEHYNNLS